jgi:DNA polymerase III epsilon subunit-like protein
VTAWYEGRLCGFDLETTAPEPEEARIVTSAIALCGGGLETETMTLLADPGVEIPAGATEVHGVTTEHAREHGKPAVFVVGATLEALRAYTAQWPLVIFNAPFDLTVLDREARRHGLEPLDLAGVRVIDPLVCDKHLHRYRKGSRKLDAQAEHYGAKLDGAHTAAYDAVCACRVAWCIGKRGRVIRRVRDGREAIEFNQLCQEWEAVRHDAERLHIAQQVWARAEMRRFAEYKAGQGEHDVAADVRSRDWPIIPLKQAVAA